MRRASTVVLVFLAIQWIAPPAHGQDQPATGSIRLLAQTPWTENEDPELRIRVRIRNDGVLPIETPAVGWVLGEAIGARADYEAALRDGPSSTAAADTRFLDAPLGPGQVEDVLLQIRTVSYDAVSKTDSGVYPLKVELRSAGIVIASLMTAEIHLVQDPRAPIALSWWTEIDVPIAFRPDGSLLDPSFEESLENRSGVVAQLEALVELGSRPRRAGVRAARFDVVVTPTALDQLEEAADGYLRPDGSRATAQDPAPAAASDAIRLLRELAEAPGVRLHATPFSGPRLPALLAAPLLAPDLEDQWRFGNEIFERILGEPPDPTVARPPALAIDGETLDALFVRGTTTILGAADSAERPVDPLDRAPPPAAVVETAAGVPMRIILPDPSTQALLADADLRRDPIALAQAVLGELATIWRELPVPEPPTVRGLAVELPRDLPPAAWAPLIRRMGRGPFLQNVYAAALPGRIEPGPEEAPLQNSRRGSFSSDYVSDLFTTARDVTALASMVREPAGETTRLRRALLYAESSHYLGDEAAGRMWIDAVNFVTDRVFDDLAPDTSRVLTFTSRTGTIPLRMGDPGDRVVEVLVEVRSQRVDFLGTGQRRVRLDADGQLVTFDAEVKASGRSTVDVFVYSPSGLEVSRSVLVVRSTAVNPAALIITVVAGVVLVGLWSRRLFRRRTE